MIDKVFIDNYKSINRLDLSLSGVNVIIGANGAGKSNILEAIAIGAAAASSKLDSEYLGSRGIRVADPRLMRNAFDTAKVNNPITISFEGKGRKLRYELINRNEQYSKWEIKSGKEVVVNDLIKYLKTETNKNDINRHTKVDQEVIQKFLRQQVPLEELEKFIVYSPENNELRKFEDDTKVEPLGVYGEGLFKLIKAMTKDELKELKSHLEMIDWFEDFYIEEDLHSSEKRIQLKDRFIDEGINFFDQRSANEGFLFLLFYLTLFISKHTPKFFAIDNIDNALNPKLCQDLIRAFVKLSLKHEKQIILTTHNPAILDGINLKDFNQSLFVAFRNIQGITKIKKIDSTNYNVDSNIRLSEAFVKGYIGGLNKTVF